MRVIISFLCLFISYSSIGQPTPETEVYATVYSETHYQGIATSISLVGTIYAISAFPYPIRSIKVRAGYNLIVEGSDCRLKISKPPTLTQIEWICHNDLEVIRDLLDDTHWYDENLSILAYFSPERLYVKKTIIPVVIKASDWKTALNTVFKSTSVRLNNHTPNKNEFRSNEYEFYRPDDSYIQMNFNGNPFRYPIPIDLMQVGTNNMYKMYVNDWNSTSLIAAPRDRKIRLTLYMEDEGIEIVGHCYNNFFCGFSDPPNFNYTNARIDIDLALTAVNKKLSYSAIATFNADISESGPCVDNLLAIFCPSNRAGLIKEKLEIPLNDVLNDTTVKNLISSIFNQLLPADTPVNEVTVSQNGDIIIK